MNEKNIFLKPNMRSESTFGKYFPVESTFGAYIYFFFKIHVPKVLSTEKHVLRKYFLLESTFRNYFPNAFLVSKKYFFLFKKNGYQIPWTTS